MNSEESEGLLLQGLPKGKVLVLFDGYCNLCNGSVQFILKRDHKEIFRYASLSWSIGQKLVKAHPHLKDVDSILVYFNGVMYDRSSAALIIAGRMGGLWPVLGFFWIVPKFIRDAVYKWIARNRYRWFGKKEQCMVPDRSVGHLFLQN